MSAFISLVIVFHSNVLIKLFWQPTAIKIIIVSISHQVSSELLLQMQSHFWLWESTIGPMARSQVSHSVYLDENDSNWKKREEEQFF